jgi:hypothetical protein
MPFAIIVILGIALQLCGPRAQVEEEADTAANQLQHQLVLVFANKEEETLGKNLLNNILGIQKITALQLQWI